MTLSPQAALRELRAVHKRLGLVLAHLAGKPAGAVAQQHGTTRPTVRKWLRRFAEAGIEGLLSEHSPGRPADVDPLIREELVRLPRESRPPLAMGDQWTTRTLAKVFDVSSNLVSLEWKKAGYDPPQHLQQVEHNPDRRVPLRIEFQVPAWLKLHLELLCRERGATLRDVVLEALAGGEGLDGLRSDVLAELRARWIAANERLPRVDPRTPEYRVELKRRRPSGD